MYLTAILKQKEEFDDLAPWVGALLLEDRFLSADSKGDYDAAEFVKKAAKRGIIPIIQADRMVYPEEMALAKAHLVRYFDLPCSFYITDLGLLYYLLEEKMEERIIYDPKTLLTNAMDIAVWSDFNVNQLGISSEITLEDVCSIIQKTGIRAFYQVFGYRLMFHSRRQLLSLYQEKTGLCFARTDCYLKEEKRPDLFPITENEQGTFIYRSGIIHLEEELSDLPLTYALIEHYNIDSKTYVDIVSRYALLLEKKTVAASITEFLAEHFVLSDGFAYQDSIYQKEEF